MIYCIEATQNVHRGETAIRSTCETKLNNYQYMQMKRLNEQKCYKCRFLPKTTEITKATNLYAT